MNYSETLSYLFDRLPMFTRVGSSAFKKDLTNTLALCKALGEPQKQFKSIHIAGTNGKGSCSHMLASILQEAGYKTGLYTSPHLKDFRERIRINGKMIEEQTVVDFVSKHKALFEEIEPSFFEWTVALCFDTFAKQKIDIAIIETGLGGRLDSTNVIIPILSIITNIGWDHMDMLGDSLTKIAQEKAGIIKPKVPAVIGEYHNETYPVFKAVANENDSPLLLSNQWIEVNHFKSTLSQSVFDIHFEYGETWKNLSSDLTGLYQQKNIATVLCSVLQLQKQGFKINENDIRHGLFSVQKNSGLTGRWHILDQHPLIVCDTGHNVNGMEWVVKQIALQKFVQLHMVIGMVKDKEINKILALLPRDAAYYFCKADIPRGLDEKELQAQGIAFQLKGKTYPSVADAFMAARKAANKEDMIFIGGSTFVVAEVV
ncbi:MAG: folylpolyglutamate synthase/dihydrofolate synthase family protein [Bacteroidota bacterium]|nr:folylpolyglutamate synthase/dihydrofolate synthase family protein [Bacteroidota bacterium]